ncbi:MAG: S8 family serine peptidase [Paludibacteraceae bacterium]
MPSLLTILSVFFVSFTDKQGCTPVAFSDRALEQRAKWAVPTDSLDYAVSRTYTDSVRALGGDIMHVSRWMNGATVECEDDIAGKIAACSFVKSVEQTRETIGEAGLSPAAKRGATYRLAGADKRGTVFGLPQSSAEVSDGETTAAQRTLLNIQPLHQAGFRGEGIRIAVIDGGFQNYPVGSRSDHALANYLDTAHWLGSYDFTDDTDDFYGETGYHGTMCLALIAGESTGDAAENDYLGTAPDADYYLIRSEEDGKESPKEMDNLVAALEKADSLGVNVVSISLGYSEFDNEEWDFGYSDMNGQTARCSRAAQIAARKGILVCVAAGNEGNKAWHYLTAPADADSILCVGAVNGEGSVAAFSSGGPSSDGRVKPDVCAVGEGACIVNPGDGSIRYGNGTSFACPLIAGMAATIWSALPDLDAMEIRRRIICSASRYHTPDADYGYGIPDAWLAYIGKEADLPTPQNTNAITCQKIYRNGSLYILRAGQYYDMMGRRVAFE